jgi:5'-3' exonuclease
MDRVLLFDTSSLFFRAFHALPAMETSRGQPTSAVYGVSVQLLQLLREQKPRGIAFALDGPQHETFRRAQYADYKSHRPAMPDAFRSQWQLLDRWLEALGAPCFAAPGYEADDVLATLSRRIATQGALVRLVTGDRDLFQVAGPDVDVYFIGRRGQKPIIYDMDAIQARFGVRIEQLPSLIALTGDTADNLPGLPGIGLKTATKLIQTHGSISALLSQLEQIDSASQRKVLSDARAQLLQNESLARLHFDAPLPDGPLYVRPTRDAFARLRVLFVELEFTRLLVRLERLADATPD